MIRYWWFSSKKMTVLVIEEDGIIIDGANIIRVFERQPLENLRKWMVRQGNFQEIELNESF